MKRASIVSWPRLLGFREGTFEAQPGDVRQRKGAAPDALARHQADLLVAAVVAVLVIGVDVVAAGRDDAGPYRFQARPLSARRLAIPMNSPLTKTRRSGSTATLSPGRPVTRFM